MARILMVADVSAQVVHGGAERMLYHHIRALVSAGHAVSVLTRQPTPDAELEIKLTELDAHEMRLKFSGDKGYQGLKQIRIEAGKWWKKHYADFDMVVAEQPFVMWALKSAGCNLPRLQVCHSFAFEEYQTRHALNPSWKHRLAIFMMQKLEEDVYTSADQLLILSDFMHQRLQAFFTITKGKSAVVPGAADSKDACDEAQRAQFRRDLAWDKPVITTLRNLVPRTGVDLLIQMAAIIKTKGMDISWVVMGDGVLRESMEAMAKDLAVDDVVSFTGFIAEEEVQKRLIASDVFLVPTRGLEGFGLVTLEANACGVPVLATPIAANAELVPKIKFNQLASNASPAALADKLLEMLKNPADAEARQAIQDDAASQYSWEKHDSGFVSMVQQVLESEKGKKT